MSYKKENFVFIITDIELFWQKFNKIQLPVKNISGTLLSKIILAICHP